MNNKASRLSTRPYKLQAYLPERTVNALEKYLSDNFPPNSRVVTTITIKALNEFLEREGYLEKKEVTDEVATDTPSP